MYMRTRLSVTVFFFQAEDGIRDLVRSRGLGDVYKRQGCEGTHRPTLRLQPFGRSRQIGNPGVGQVQGLTPVSYTHLTLPTSDLV